MPGGRYQYAALPRGKSFTSKKVPPVAGICQLRFRPLGSADKKQRRRVAGGMAPEKDIEKFIGDSFGSVWDLELLRELLDTPGATLAPHDLVERMRASEQIVAQGSRALVAAGIALIDDDGRLRFQPVNDAVAKCARDARDFYIRFPGRTRRLIVATRSPGLTAFADAFRLQKDKDK